MGFVFNKLMFSRTSMRCISMRKYPALIVILPVFFLSKQADQSKTRFNIVCYFVLWIPSVRSANHHTTVSSELVFKDLSISWRLDEVSLPSTENHLTCKRVVSPTYQSSSVHSSEKYNKRPLEDAAMNSFSYSFT